MVALVALLALQVPSKKLWAVGEFADLTSGRLGFAAANAVAGRLAEDKRYEIVGPEAVRKAADAIGVETPVRGIVNVNRVGAEALGEAYTRGAVVVGEVFDRRIERVSGGRRARVSIRAVVYDVVSATPINGAREIGASPARTSAVSDDALAREAVLRAADAVVRALRATSIPTATIVRTHTRGATIDRGARAGFQAGDSVGIGRGSRLFGSAHVAEVGPDRAEIRAERILRGWARGDWVRKVFVPPEPPPGPDAGGTPTPQ